MGENKMRGKRKENQGAAMVIVLCVLVVFLALSASVLLAGSVALNTARNNIMYEQGKVQAVTLSDLITADMETPGLDIEGNPGISGYIKEELKKDWPAYDPDGPGDPEDQNGVLKKFIVQSDINDKPYSVNLEMYWENGTADQTKTDDSRFNGTQIHITAVSKIRQPDFRVQCVFTTNVTGEASNYAWSWTAAGRK